MELGTEWPLAGRVGELRQLQRLLDTREQRGVVIAGPAGVGKTRLARECLAVAERSGAAAAWATATRSAAGLPFGAIAPLLPAAATTGEGAAENRTDLLRRAAEALTETARGRPLTLAVDDAHLLDDASATLVYQLAANRAAFVLLTIRAGEPVPDPITALWKDGLAVRLELRGLPADAVGDVLASVLGGQVDQATVVELTIHSEGNVMFLRELVLGALEDGSLRNDGGVWRHDVALSPSERLVELVEARIGSLTAQEQNLLELVSYAEPLGAAELSALGSADIAGDLERRGLLASWVDGRRLQVRVAHPLYSDVVRARIPAVRLRTVARSLADVVDTTGARRREDALRVATWRLDGGGAANPQVMLQAAATARWRYDFPLAERLASAAVDAGAGFEAALLVAQLASLQGRTQEAEEQLGHLAPAAPTEADRARATLIRLENLNFALGLGQKAFRVIEEAESRISDPTWRAEIAATRAGVVLGTQGPRAAADSASAVIEGATGRALMLASLVACFSLARLGRLGPAFRAAEQGEEAHRTVSGPLDWYPWFSHSVRCECLTQAGRLDEALDLAGRHYADSLAQGSTEGRAFFAWHPAKAIADRGDVEVSIRQTREAAGLFRQLGRPAFERNALVPLAAALAMAGRAKEATEVLETVETLPVDPALWVATELVHARALTAMASGRLTQAKELLGEAAALGERIGDLVETCSVLHTLARMDRPEQHVTRLNDVASEIEGPLAAARAAHGRALVRNDPEALEAVSGDFERMGAHLRAVHAAVDAARAWSGAGDARHVAARTRASQLAHLCEGAVIPGLQATGPDARLTPAETEAALLVAAGHSNKEIAGILSLSVRTIENRLQKIYEKLGLSSRTELAALFTGPVPPAGS